MSFPELLIGPRSTDWLPHEHQTRVPAHGWHGDFEEEIAVSALENSVQTLAIEEDLVKSLDCGFKAGIECSEPVHRNRDWGWNQGRGWHLQPTIPVLDESLPPWELGDEPDVGSDRELKPQFPTRRREDHAPWLHHAPAAP
jgi:hypothetical protein